MSPGANKTFVPGPKENLFHPGLFSNIIVRVFNMRFITFFTASLLLLVTPVFVAGQSKTDRETANLLGPVKSVRNKTIDLGRSSNGDFVIYSEAGNEITREMVSDFGEAIGKTSQTFGAQGLLTERVWTDPKGRISRDVYSYKDGKLIQQLTYNGTGALVEKTGRSYDAAGRAGEEIYYSADDKPVAKTVYRYVTGSDPVEVAFFLSDGRKATAPVGPCLGAHRVEYTYDKIGRVVGRRVFEDDGALKKSYKMTYDAKGNIAEYVSESASGLTTTFIYSYEFDPKGNWIKKTATSTMKEEKPLFGNGTPYVRTTVTTREIIYY